MRHALSLAPLGCALALVSVLTGCSSLTQPDPIRIAAEAIPGHATAPDVAPPAPAPAPPPAAAPGGAPASGG